MYKAEVGDEDLGRESASRSSGTMLLLVLPWFGRGLRFDMLCYVAFSQSALLSEGYQGGRCPEG